jgi:hypothetical protein
MTHGCDSTDAALSRVLNGAVGTSSALSVTDRQLWTTRWLLCAQNDHLTFLETITRLPLT